MEGRKSVQATIVLFGGTGDLTKRKLVPAFANLAHQGIINRESTLIGIGRKNFDDSTYKKFLIDSISDEKEKEHIKEMNIKFFRGDLSKPEELSGLKEMLQFCEGPECNRIYYLATSFKFFPAIVKELKKYHMLAQKDGFTRIVFEKPFGEDLKSSNKLDKEIHKVFPEENIYRIDHYLAKDTVQNLNVLKFTNPIMHSTLNNKYVKGIDIIAYENLGVANRLEYYNDSGAVKDMIQSHLLQMLALLLMQRPKKFEQKDIHDEKVKILKNLEITKEEDYLFGQYESYKKELQDSGLPDKQTETFASVMLNCKTKDWNGVKIRLRTGRKLEKKIGKIIISFKDEEMPGWEGLANNKVVINIFPHQDIEILMNAKDARKTNHISPVNFVFSHEKHFGPNTINEYAALLEEVLKGDKTLFTRTDELRESWKIVEEIEKLKGKSTLVSYKDGEDGDKI